MNYPLLCVLFVFILYVCLYSARGYSVVFSDSNSDSTACVVHSVDSPACKRVKDSPLCYSSQIDAAITHGCYYRHPIRVSASTNRSNPFLYEDNRKVTNETEFSFRQDYILKKYVGSSLEERPIPHRNDSCYPYGITFVAQASWDLFPFIISKERLFFVEHFLKRWGGWRCIISLIPRPISITVIVHRNELHEMEQFIQQSHFPDRLTLTLYIIDVSSNPDCVFTQLADGSMQCEPGPIYPLNRLRNIAIESVSTSHFVLFDMDVWPSRGRCARH